MRVFDIGQAAQRRAASTGPTFGPALTWAYSGITSFSGREYKTISFSINNTCDVNCEFCLPGLSQRKEEALPVLMTRDEWLRAVDSIAEFGLAEMVIVAALEPLNDEDSARLTCDIIKRAKARGLRAGLVTNGKNTLRFIDLLVDANPDVIATSIDAVGKSHDVRRKAKGLYEDITPGIRALTERGFRKRLIVSTIAMSEDPLDYQTDEFVASGAAFGYLGVKYLNLAPRLDIGDDDTLSIVSWVKLKDAIRAWARGAKACGVSQVYVEDPSKELSRMKIVKPRHVDISQIGRLIHDRGFHHTHGLYRKLQRDDLKVRYWDPTVEGLEVAVDAAGWKHGSGS